MVTTKTRLGGYLQRNRRPGLKLRFNHPTRRKNAAAGPVQDTPLAIVVVMSLFCVIAYCCAAYDSPFASVYQASAALDVRRVQRHGGTRCVSVRKLDRRKEIRRKLGMSNGTEIAREDVSTTVLSPLESRASRQPRQGKLRHTAQPSGRVGVGGTKQWYRGNRRTRVRRGTDVCDCTQLRPDGGTKRNATQQRSKTQNGRDHTRMGATAFRRRRRRRARVWRGDAKRV